MRPLATRLEKADLPTVRFGYSSRASPATIANQLADWLATQPVPPRHFVAHSLGGLILAHLFDCHPEFACTEARIVLLGSPLGGSPLGGSAVARRLAAGQIGQWLLAGSLDAGLDDGAPAWQAANTLMIAGTRPLGPGRLLPETLDGPNDGTVAVAETRVPGLAAHECLPVNHFGMLLSRLVAEMAIAFLHDQGATKKADPRGSA